MGEFEPQIVGFFCNWCSHTVGDLSGILQTKHPSNVMVIRVMCSGRINERFILEAFIAGADGILICSCQPGDCHYQTGNLYARRRVVGLSSFLDSVGIGKDRIRQERISESEAANLADIIQNFTHTIKQLGPSSFKMRPSQHYLSTT